MMIGYRDKSGNQEQYAAHLQQQHVGQILPLFVLSLVQHWFPGYAITEFQQ